MADYHALRELFQSTPADTVCPVCKIGDMGIEYVGSDEGFIDTTCPCDTCGYEYSGKFARFGEYQ